MKRNSGFTLIELLVVVAIIGILAQVAIPQFTAYRQRSFDSRAKSDLFNLAKAQEAYFIDSESYKSCATSATCKSTLPGFKSSQGVTLAATVPASTYFTATANHPKGTGSTFTWDSNNGGLQLASAVDTPPVDSGASSLSSGNSCINDMSIADASNNWCGQGPPAWMDPSWRGPCPTGCNGTAPDCWECADEACDNAIACQMRE